MSALLTLGTSLLITGCLPLREARTETPQDQPITAEFPTERNPIPSPTMTSGATQTPPLATSVPDVHPTDTQTPVQIPTVESGITAYLPVKGNADKIAFIHEQEIWMVNLDGSELTQLTDDEQPKSSLRWFTDTQGVIYLSGSCAILIDINTSETNPLICFEGADRLETFEIAPDSSQVAISLDRQLYVLPFDQDKLNTAKSSDDLIAMANCTTFAPYKSNVTVKSALWSADGNHLAILRQGNDTGQLVDMIHIIDLSNCVSPIPLLDEFPATRFEMEDYVENPIIQNFAWDGKDLFALTSFRRNDGFGDLWIYSYDLHRGFLANPVEGKCCYRDPVFSPDGNYLAFVFQDAKMAPKGPARLYYIPYDAIDTSLVYPPVSLPGDFLSDPRTKPQPALRPVP